MILISFIFMIVSSAFAEDVLSPVIGIKQGKLQGLVRESRNGNKYYAFLSIPYGKFLTRFEPPIQGDSWDGVRNATKLGPHCYQFCLILGRLVGSEDCLTLNIHTRKLDGKLPVMVLFHGGGFQFGSGNFHDGKYFMDEEVVLVTVQYRLGALGFLNTEDDVVTGNMGLKDQNRALKWVQENINSFGGDATQVTIFGYSAGGASVQYHMLSPMSKGLFRYAISQSGTALNPWAFQTRPKALAERISRDLGCTTATTKEMVACLRSIPAEYIVHAQIKLSKYSKEFDLISMLFTPSIDKGTVNPKFLNDTPYHLTVKGQTVSKVPWISGVTADEGAFYTANLLDDPKCIEKLNRDWFEMLPNILYYEDKASPDTLPKITGKVKEFYFPGGKITKDDYLKVGQFLGDRFFNVGVARTIKEYAKLAEFPVWPYILNFTGSHSIVQGMLKAERAYGVAHVDDLKYLFDKTYLSPEFGLDTPDGQFSSKLVKLFVSFARDGKPTGTWGSAKSWEPYKIVGNVNASHVQWYIIDDDTRISKEDVFKERSDFWESLPLREWDKEDLQN